MDRACNWQEIALDVRDFRRVRSGFGAVLPGAIRKS
jgi:hypothetical protein